MIILEIDPPYRVTLPVCCRRLGPDMASPDYQLIVHMYTNSHPDQLNVSWLVTEATRVIPSHPAPSVELPRERVLGQAGRGVRRVCTGTPVRYDQTVRARVARPGRRMR